MYPKVELCKRLGLKLQEKNYSRNSVLDRDSFKSCSPAVGLDPNPTTLRVRNTGFCEGVKYLVTLYQIKTSKYIQSVLFNNVNKDDIYASTSFLCFIMISLSGFVFFLFFV